MKGFSENIEKLTLENDNFRQVLYFEVFPIGIDELACWRGDWFRDSRGK